MYYLLVISRHHYRKKSMFMRFLIPLMLLKFFNHWHVFKILSKTLFWLRRYVWHILKTQSEGANSGYLLKKFDSFLQKCRSYVVAVYLCVCLYRKFCFFLFAPISSVRLENCTINVFWLCFKFRYFSEYYMHYLSR